MNTAKILCFANSSNNPINYNDANRFIDTLFGRCSQGFIEIRPLPVQPGERKWIPVTNIQIPVLPTDKDIYIGVATRQENKGTKDALVQIPALWVDVDFEDIDRDEAEKRIQSCQREPSITVESGNGFHCYWLLSTPATINDVQRIEDINKRMSSYLGGDPASAEAAHILRLPETYNHKYEPPQPVTLSSINDKTYQLSDFNFLPPLPPSLPQALSQVNNSGLYDDLLQGVPKGQRHHTAVKLTSRFKRSGMSTEEIYGWLALWNQKNSPPLSEQELFKTVNDVYKRYGQSEFSLKEEIAEIVDYGKILEEAVMPLSDFIRKQYPVREYILKPLIRPGEIGMISSERGIGKTWLALAIALAATMNFPLARWEKVNQTGCLYIDGEMPGDLLQQRVRDLLRGDYNQKPPLIFLSSDDMRSKGQPAPRLTSLGWRDAILNYLKEHGEIGLLIIDNLASLTPGADENTKRDWDDINQWLLELRAIGKAIIMIHHSGKGGQQRGTSSREDILDFSIKLKRPEGYVSDKGATFIVEFTKARSIYGADAKPFTLQLLSTSIGVCVEKIDDEDASKRDAILSLHKSGSRGKEIAAILSVSQSYVSQVLTKAKNPEVFGGTGKSNARETLREMIFCDEAYEPEEQEAFTVEPVHRDGEDKIN
jgi:hypothetical protein